MTDEPTPIAYTALPKGVPVQTGDADEIGTVEQVLSVPEEDLFDGIVIETSGGHRFVDADQVATITTAYVRTTLDSQQARDLPAPGGAAVYRADPTEDAGRGWKDRLGRLFGKGSWRRRQ